MDRDLQIHEDIETGKAREGFRTNPPNVPFYCSGKNGNVL